jgi:hypothetical protein
MLLLLGYAVLQHPAAITATPIQIDGAQNVALGNTRAAADT